MQKYDSYIKMVLFKNYTIDNKHFWIFLEVLVISNLGNYNISDLTNLKKLLHVFFVWICDGLDLFIYIGNLLFKTLDICNQLIYRESVIKKRMIQWICLI